MIGDPYARARRRNVVKIRQWKTGVVTLTRTTHAPRDPDTPWQPGAATPAVYTLDARVDGAAEFASETILATDLVVIASPKATLNNVVVDFEPVMSDTLAIDGVVHVIKKIDALPAAGAAARFHIFVAS